MTSPTRNVSNPARWSSLVDLSSFPSGESADPIEGPVFLFDFDGTLTTEELLPLIADELGLDDIRDLTDRTMQGELNFEESFRQRVELLAEVPRETVAEIVLAVPLQERLMDWIGERQDRCWIVTGNLDCWVAPWLERWGLRGFASTSTIEDGRLTIASDGVLDKRTVLANFVDNPTVMVGDGANDAGIVREADFGVAAQFVHTVPELLRLSADCVVNEEGALCRILSRW